MKQKLASNGRRLIAGKVFHFFWYQFPALLWAGVLFYASSLPSISVLEFGFDFEDKLKHVTAYAILGFLLARAFRHQSRRLLLREKAIRWAAILGAMYGLSDEIHQAFVPGRSPEVGDFLADALGAWLGSWLFGLWPVLKARIGQKWRALLSSRVKQE